MHSQNSKVDVLLPTYNVEKYIGKTLDSLRHQTLQNINILVCDDCSNDGTVEIIKRYQEKDSRIKLFTNTINKGIVETRNKLFQLSSSDYLAICDADDIYSPERLKVQVDFLSQNKEVDAVSSYFNVGVEEPSICKLPLENDLIKAYLHLKNVFPNPGAMIRKWSLVQKKLKYTEEFKYASDFDFWSKFSETGRLANINKCLFSYRLHSQQISEIKKSEQKENHLKIVRKKFKKLNTPFCESSIKAIVWQHKEQTYYELQSVCREVNKIIRNLSYSCHTGSLVPYVYDISLRSYCKKYRLEGLKNYTRHRGFKNLVKGKFYGLNFVFDCLKTKQ